MNALSMRLRHLFLVAAALFVAVPVFADTLMMPKRDALKGTSLVIWGVTTLPNGSTSYSIDFGDGTTSAGTVSDRSYITFNKNYSSGGVKHVVLTVTNGATTEIGSVDIQVFDPAVISATDLRNVRINMAIEDGFRYLWFSQSARTAFDTNNQTNWGRASWTALVALAFENHGYRLPNNNSVPTGLYERFIVRRALNTLIAGLSTITLTNQTFGDPCAGAAPAAEHALTNTCIGYFNAPETIGNAGYVNALMILPFAGSGALSRTNTEVTGVTANKTFGEITQRLVDAMAWGQNDSGAGQGGWNYGFNTTIMDGSTAGWNILAILDAEAASIALPSFLKTQFSLGINHALNSDGSFDYNADNNATSIPGASGYRNLTRIGISLQALFFNGVPIPYAAGSIGANAITQISNRWGGLNFPGDTYFDTCGPNQQNKGCAYAMFNLFKGLKLANVSTLPGVSASGGRADNDWYKDYQDWFLANQSAPNTTNGGFWSTAVMGFSCCVDDTNANNAIAELILSPVALVLPDEDKFKTIGLSPLTRTATEGGTHTVTAHAESTGGAAVPGATVVFNVIAGPNTGVTGTNVTDAQGNAQFTYTDGGPIGTFGLDKIRASIGSLLSNTVDMNWKSVNRAPVATNNSYASNEDTLLSRNVITDAPADTDADGDVMTASLITATTHGVILLNGDGSFSYTPAANYCGPDSFSYQITDSLLTSGVASVSINVICVNDAPTADDDAASTDEDTALSGSVTANDGDIDSAQLTWSKTSNPAHGTAVVNANGTFTYTPQANYCGADSFNYQVSDGSLSDTAAVAITVNCVNDSPTAGDDTAATNEDTALNASVTANDNDVDSASLTWSKTFDVAHGSLIFNADGTYVYTPAANYCGADSFSYQVSDGSLTDPATVSITVNCVNDAPTADDDAASTDEDTPLNGAVNANDSDIDSASLTWSKASDPSHGSVSVNGNGTFTYTPNANYCGPDSFTYQVSDGSLSDTATVAITVNCVNDAPTADDDAASTDEDTPLNGSVNGNDGDIDSVQLTWSKASDASHGLVAVNGDGTFSYAPNANYCGPDSFTYQVTDGALADTATVSIIVNCVDDPPVAAASSQTTNEDTVLTGTAAFTDIDGGAAPVFAIVMPPAHGTLVLNGDGSYVYTPNANYFGSDAFSFTADGGTAPATVSIEVNSVDDPAVATGSSQSVNEDAVLSGTATFTDIDGGAPPVFEITMPPVHGALILNGDGSYVYTPNADYFGSDAFSFTASDGTAPATVSIEVNSVDDPAVASGASQTTNEDSVLTGTAAFTDIDGGAAPVFAIVMPPAHGTLVLNGDGSYVYTPFADFFGSDAFSFTASNGTAPATVSIEVNSVDDPAVATGSSQTTNEDSVLTGTATFTDIDGGAPPVFEITMPPVHGALVLNADGSYIYTPNANYFGSDAFSFTASSGTAPATIAIEVNSVDDPAVASGASQTTTEDSVLTGTAAFTDVDGGAPPVFEITMPPVHGALVLNADGSYIYTPAADYFGSDAFSFTASNGTAPATVSIEVNSVDDPPVATSSSQTTNEDSSVSGSLTFSDIDGGAPPVFAIVMPPAHGTLAFNADGSYVYTPNTNYFGGDAFTFTASAGTPPATLSIAVNGGDDPPVATGSTQTTNEDGVLNGSVTFADIDGGAPPVFSIVMPPAHGTLVLNADGSYIYTPNADYFGGDSFSFTASVGTAPATVAIAVTAVDDPPVATGGAATTNEDTSLSGTLTSTDIDGGPAPIYSVITPPSHGTLQLNPDGTYVYTPAPNYNGTDAFTFDVSDGHGHHSQATVNITATAVNDPPFCAAATPSVAFIWPPNHQLVDVNVLGVSDPVEGSAVTIRIDSIWQDEPTNTVGDGNTPIDGYGVGTSKAQVRAERSGNKKVPGDGRMYHIFFTGKDADGATCKGEVTVAVPHDQGNGSNVSDGGPIYKSTGS